MNPARRKKSLTILIDWLDPAYLEPSDVPNLRRLIADGFYRVGKGVIPTVTNVNNASVVTSVFPQEHGVVSNFHYDARTDHRSVGRLRSERRSRTYCCASAPNAAYRCGCRPPVFRKARF